MPLHQRIIYVRKVCIQEITREAFPLFDLRS
ncbi:hypothetical protein CTO_0999 [Chlamydia trachomatis A2497]|uniref:Uncharacterized protein n=1 Tax=Chlamydia trachomatis serovar A (strain A2497) TaxID=580047 RepID=G4NN48_CHLT4|nr:hypothetical protein CTO_0999 [Chlamydia trachomatis A2497]